MEKDKRKSEKNPKNITKAKAFKKFTLGIV